MSGLEYVLASMTFDGYVQFLAKSMSDPKFWGLVFIGCLVQAIFKATVDHFRK